eukprot:1090478-Prymnesium_polylepis.1
MQATVDRHNKEKRMERRHRTLRTSGRSLSNKTIFARKIIDEPEAERLLEQVRKKKIKKDSRVKFDNCSQRKKCAKQWSDSRGENKQDRTESPTK